MKRQVASNLILLLQCHQTHFYYKSGFLIVVIAATGRLAVHVTTLLDIFFQQINTNAWQIAQIMSSQNKLPS